MSEKLGNVGNVVSPEYRAHMAETVEKGLCPFCDPDQGGGFDPKVNKVILSGNYHRCWKNPFAHGHQVGHFMIVPYQHVLNMNDLPKEAWLERENLIQQLIEQYNLRGGGIVTRFGENELNAGTVAHAHSQIMAPDGTGPVVAPFYKGPIFDAYIKMVRSNDPQQIAAFLAMIKD